MNDHSHNQPVRRGPSFVPLSEEDKSAIAALEAEIADLEEQAKAGALEIRRLQEAEVAGQGPFAQEIFRLQQQKMVLATEMQHRKVRANALRWGI
jgi:hypothetical protein